MLDLFKVRVTDLQGFRVVNALTTETRTKEMVTGGDEASNSCSGVNGTASLVDQSNVENEPATGASMPNDDGASSTDVKTRSKKISQSVARKDLTPFLDEAAQSPASPPVTPATGVNSLQSPPIQNAENKSAALLKHTKTSPAIQAAVASILVHSDSPASPDMEPVIPAPVHTHSVDVLPSTSATDAPVPAEMEQSSSTERAIASILAPDASQVVAKQMLKREKGRFTHPLNNA